MYLFDVHTHHENLSKCHLDDSEIISILNIYPSDIYDKDLKNNSTYFSAGLHPWYLDNDADKQLKILESIIRNERLVAIGECGLDKLRGVDMEIQKDIFRKQIELSEKYHKPLIIHCVKAWDELIEIRKGYRTHEEWIIHGFRGKVEQMHQLSDLGFKFSYGFYSNLQAVKATPINSLFCETDQGEKGILEVYENIAGILNISIDSLSKLIEKNITRTFPQIV